MLYPGTECLLADSIQCSTSSTGISYACSTHSYVATSFLFPLCPFFFYKTHRSCSPSNLINHQLLLCKSRDKRKISDGNQHGAEGFLLINPSTGHVYRYVLISLSMSQLKPLKRTEMIDSSQSCDQSMHQLNLEIMLTNPSHLFLSFSPLLFLPLCSYSVS